MSTFVLACVALIFLSGLFLLVPFRRSRNDDEALRQANVEWYRLREKELSEEGADALRDDAALRLLEDEQADRAQSVAMQDNGKTFPRWVLLPLVAVSATLLYYALGAAPDVLISRQLDQLDENTSKADREQVMQAIAERAAQRPGNIDYTAMLGRYYMGRQDFSRAAETYDELARQLPGEAQPLAYAAQAEYLAAGRKLTDSARNKAARALAINPHERTALGLLGMVSYEEGKYREAIDYWQRLLAVENPASDTAHMISGIIASAKTRLGEGDDVAATADNATDKTDHATAADSIGPGVTVHVALPQGAKVAAGDTVFVLARNPQSGSRMPIAVKRLQASQLPLTLRLDDSSSMAGQKLSQADSIVVIVQVSPSGRPGEASATWLGQAGPLAPSVDESPVQIELHPRGA